MVDTFYLAYGNEASISHVYGPIALIVRVGKPGAREVIIQTEEGGEGEKEGEKDSEEEGEDNANSD
ncbi:hypothetical protein BOTBODRAFT_32411 [Botryobasidium botryosum FD-172 SS1]|uniref:Uncharacterized protein n=1 Tax=Botryobasidium botryosum (strain FD-172 SS1) TaxID=930990 RepID=A0A067MFR9_BOTB1|nr:hypothetical protein BOTBODRAFT_32411 [Botryobasidium botryosum FD-172 SS1]